MAELTLKTVRAILHDWGGLARSGAGPAQLLHGYPTRNPIDRMRQATGPGGPDDWNPTPPEAAISRMEGWRGSSLTVHELIRGLPLIPAMCIAAHYRDKQDVDKTGELLGLDRSAIYRHRQRGEEAILRALEKQRPAVEPLHDRAA